MRSRYLAFEDLNAAQFDIETAYDNDGYVVHRMVDHIDMADGLDKSYDNPAVGAALRNILTQHDFDLVHIISGYLLGGQVIHTAHEFGVPVAITLTEYWFMCTRLNLLQHNGSLCSGPESDEKCARCLLEDKRRYSLPAAYLPAPVTDAFWSVAAQMPFAQQMAQAVARRRTNLQAALDAADLVICPSQTLIDMFAQFDFDTQRFVFLRQGINPPAQRPEPQPSEVMRFVYVGQIQPHKGIDLVVDAAVRLLDQGYKLRLDLWGPDTQFPDYSDSLKGRSQAYPTIRWQGKFLGEKIWSILADSDALVIPSRWYENSPHVILEAFTMGLPAIGTRLGGMAELIQHEHNGLLFALNDSVDLSAQMQRLIDDPALLPRLRQGIPTLQTIGEEMEQLAALYEQVLTQREAR